MGEKESAGAMLEIQDKQYHLKVGQVYMVGKRSNQEAPTSEWKIELDAEFLDEKHALIEVRKNAVYLTDLTSIKGTFVQGRRLDALVKTAITDGEAVICFGDVEGKLYIPTLEESHDSSGFHDGHKNTFVDIICSSPEHETHTQSRLRRLKNKGAQFGASSALAQESSSTNEQNTSAETTAESIANNNSLDNNKNKRTSDSFTIPETQYFLGTRKRSLNVSNSSCASDGKSSRLEKSKNEDDFCIPETQEIAAHHNENYAIEVIEPNVPVNIFADDSTESQFRICTLDYNEMCPLEDINMQIQCSIVIPRITHELVILNEPATAEQMQDESKANTSTMNPNENITNEDDEIMKLNWSTANNSKNDAQNTSVTSTEREGDCTPDLFDMAELAEVNFSTKDTIRASQMHTLAEEQKNTSNNQLVAENTTEKKVEVPSAPAVDDEDLMPTQVFISGPRKTAAAVIPFTPSPVGLTSSDKKNELSCAVVTAVSKDTEATPLFPTKEDIHATKPVIPFITPHTDINVDDDDPLAITQVFPVSKKTYGMKQKKNVAVTANKKSLNSTLVCAEDDNKNVRNVLSFFEEMEESVDAPKMNEFKKPKCSLLKKASTSSAVSTTSAQSNLESQCDFDIDMCTPKLIKTNFENISDIQPHLLFRAESPNSDDGDDGDDIAKILRTQKTSHDFEKLLPHLKATYTPPKGSGTNAKVWRNLFDDSDEKRKERCTIKSRDERQVDREMKRAVLNNKKTKQEVKATKKTANDEKMNKRATRKANEMEKLEPNEVEKSQQDKKKRETKVQSKQVETPKENEKSKLNDSRKRKISENKIDVEKPAVKNTSKSEKTKNDKAAAKETSLEAPPTSSSNTNVKDNKKEKLKDKVKPAKRNKEHTADEADDNLLSKGKQISRIRKRLHINSDSQETEADNQLPAKRVTRAQSRCSSLKEFSEAEEEHKTKNVTSTQIQKEQNKILPNTEAAKEDIKNVMLAAEKSRSRSSRSQTVSQEIIIANNTSITNNCADEHKRLRNTSSKDEERAHLAQSSYGNKQIAKLKVSMSMVEPELFQKLEQNSAGLWTIATDPIESDILIMDKGNRTFKFLIAMARGIPIVTSKWLECVNRTKIITKRPEHFFRDANFEKRHKFSLLKSLDLARKSKIFDTYEFLMTENILPKPDEIKAIIQCAGGVVHMETPKFKENQKLYLISVASDKRYWHKYRRDNKNLRIIGTEGVMTSVMRQTVSMLEMNLLA